MSVDDDERMDLLERLFAKDAAGTQLIDARERLFFPRCDDFGRRCRPDAGKLLELRGRGRVDVDQATGVTCDRGAVIVAWLRRHRIAARRDPDLLTVGKQGGEVQFA